MKTDVPKNTVRDAIAALDIDAVTKKAEADAHAEFTALGSGAKEALKIAYGSEKSVLNRICYRFARQMISEHVAHTLGVKAEQIRDTEELHALLAKYFPDITPVKRSIVPTAGNVSGMAYRNSSLSKGELKALVIENLPTMFERAAMRTDFRRAINLTNREYIKEAARFTDLTFYERHLFPGDDVAQYDRVPDNSALWVEKKYTLEVAIRDKRSGIGSQNKPYRAVFNPRRSQETLTIYVVVRVVWGGAFIKIDERVCKIRWPYNQDSDAAFFRIAFTTLPARESRAEVDVRLYHENLDLLDMVSLQFSVVADMAAAAQKSLIVRPRTPAVPQLDPDAAIRELNITISPADGGCFGLDFLFKRNSDEIKIGFERTLKLEDLEKLVAKVRDFWTELAIGVYADRPSVTQTTWDKMLKKLHALGADAWDILFGTRSSDQKGASETVGDLVARLKLSSSTHIQVSYAKGLKDFIFPWSILHPAPVSDVKVDQFEFWGARYQIEQVREGANKNKLDEEPVGINVVFDKGFGQTVAQDEMFKLFGKLAGDRLSIKSVGSDKPGVLAALNSAPPSHMYYFFCHGYTPTGEAKYTREVVDRLRDIVKRAKLSNQEREVWDGFLDLIRKNGDESWIYTGSAQIRENELRREPFFSEPAGLFRRPIIFLNMCQSAALMPSMTTGFVRLFLDHGAEAVIGTESPMTSVFADAFARELLRYFLRGSDLGTSLLQARRHFLGDEVRNPLGLAYTLYGRATAKIGSHPLLVAD